MIGTHLTHYRIVERLGGGAMGVVYRARDEHLDRDVALKILPEGGLASPQARHRFRREALALSRLNHPHIATIHDFSSHDGVDFLVMELVEGPTLRARLAAGPLAEPEVVSIGGQIAEALEAAHDGGVLHRDLKPENIALGTRGRVKVLDFGVANLVQAAETVTASRSGTGGDLLAGTLLYMAPELLLGSPGDHRSDLYSLGVVLYELATGRTPFQARLATALVYEIVNGAPPAPSRIRHDLSPRLEDVILKCLEKNPDLRYQSGRELLVDFNRLAAAAAAPDSPLRPQRGRSGRIESILVLPLENLSGDPEQEFFADGMTDALIADLAQIGDLHVISRTSAMRYKGTSRPLSEVARELNVDAVIEGTVLRFGDRVRITAQLILGSSDRLLWSRSYQRDLADVLALQGEVAAAIAAEVRAKLTPAQHARLTGGRPVDPAAFEAYLRGRQSWNRRTEPELRRALDWFKKSIDADPAYPLAYAGLADAYNILGDMNSFPPDVAAASARAAAARALELDPDLAEAHTSVGFVRAFFEWDWAGAEAAYRRALELKPSYATGRQWYAELLISQGRLEEAVREARTAVDLDPLATVLRTSLADSLFFSRRYDQAIAELERTLQIEPDFPAARTDLGRALTQAGRYEEAIAAFESAIELGGQGKASPGLGYAYAMAGRAAEARAILERLLERRGERYVQPHAIAVLHVGLGELEPALDWLETAFRERDRAMVWLKVHPRLDPLRGRPRFDALLRQMKLA